MLIYGVNIMLNNFWNSIERSGHINLAVGIILFIGSAITLTLVGIIIHKSNKKKSIN